MIAGKPLIYLVFHKPYGVLSQFTREGGKPSLKDFGPFPPDVYPVGRLDSDSEGMLILTNDNQLKHRLTDPRFHHQRSYLVQVERLVDETSLDALRKGVLVQRRKTRPATVVLLTQDPDVPPRSVPIRYRKKVPAHWLLITMTEGRNRQIRRMTAAVGHPTLRLIRIGIGSLSLEALPPGRSRPLTAREVEKLLDREPKKNARKHPGV